MRQFVACVLLLSPLSCSNNRSVMERELAEMRQKIAILQSERERLEQRVQLLERRAPASGAAHPQALAAATTEGGARHGGTTGAREGGAWQRPPLQVVRLTPSAPPGDASEVVERDGSERYLIYGTGDELKVRELPTSPATSGAALPPAERRPESRP